MEPEDTEGETFAKLESAFQKSIKDCFKPRIEGSNIVRQSVPARFCQTHSKLIETVFTDCCQMMSTRSEAAINNILEEKDCRRKFNQADKMLRADLLSEGCDDTTALNTILPENVKASLERVSESDHVGLLSEAVTDLLPELEARSEMLMDLIGRSEEEIDRSVCAKRIKLAEIQELDKLVRTKLNETSAKMIEVLQRVPNTRQSLPLSSNITEFCITESVGNFVNLKDV